LPNLVPLLTNKPESLSWANKPVELYTQHFILLVTYGWAWKDRMFIPGKPFQTSVLYHSSLLGTYVSYLVIEVLWV
jgi:hypothetical protein